MRIRNWFNPLRQVPTNAEIASAFPWHKAAALGQEIRRLLETLVGDAAVLRFRELVNIVARVRHYVANHQNALASILRDSAPEIFEMDDGEYAARLSYRLYLRRRLKKFCVDNQWKSSQGPVSEAVNALTRSDLGEAFTRSLDREFGDGCRLVLQDLAVCAR